MKTFLLLISTIILTSCGQMFNPDVVYSTKRYFDKSNPYFDKYKSSFERDYYMETGKSVSTGLPINFSNDIYFPENPKVVGVCFHTGRKGIEILIKESYWNRLSSVCRKQLIYHELGHCVIGQDHRDTHLSVMNSNTGRCEKFDDYENELITELMNQSNADIPFLKRVF